MLSKCSHIALSFMLLLVCQVVQADTREGYQNSTTRQQIERMDEQSRFNAKDTPNSPSTGIKGSALEGQLNRLRAEQEAEQEAKAVAAAKRQADLEARWALERVRMREEAQRLDAEKARTRARELQQIESRQASMLAYIRSLPANAPMTVANYDQLLDLAAPLSELMLPIAEAAYRDYPQAFALRQGFLKLSTCQELRTEAVAKPNFAYVEERNPLAECVARQLSVAVPFLEQARQSGDAVDVALACALMAGASANLASFDGTLMEEVDILPMRPRIEAWLDKRLQPCALVAPPGSPLYIGLIEPFVREVEVAEGRWNSLRVNSQYLWPLVARTSWAGVNVKDPNAVARVQATALARFRAMFE